jgi:NADH:ubiquinone oxidoreductase subunit 6 (subunit J)
MTYYIPFVLVGLLCLFGLAVLVITMNLVYAAFALFTVLLGVAAAFAVVGADFLAVTQLIVYVGGILILLMFGLMLSRRTGDQMPRSQVSNQLPAAVLAGGLVGWLGKTYWALPPTGNLPMPGADTGTTKPIGIMLLSDYLLAFEVLSFLLLLALVAAAYLTRRPGLPGRDTRTSTPTAS